MQPNLTFTQDYRTVDENTNERVPERCYLQVTGATRSMDSTFRIGISDTVWRYDMLRAEENYDTAVSFALGLTHDESDNKSTNEDFQMAMEVHLIHNHTHDLPQRPPGLLHVLRTLYT
jgi:hypothetical protein